MFSEIICSWDNFNFAFRSLGLLGERLWSDNTWDYKTKCKDEQSIPKSIVHLLCLDILKCFQNTALAFKDVKNWSVLVKVALVSCIQ